MKIKSISEFIEWHYKLKGNFLFRGQSDVKYILIPKISRKEKNKIIIKEKFVERENRLDQYLSVRLPAYDYDFHNLEVNHKKWKEYFIAQHYGAPTRLLDFTRNPLVALFFSVIENPTSNGIVYAVKRFINKTEGPLIRHLQLQNIFDYQQLTEQYNPRNLPLTVFVVPPHIDKRIMIQQSVFCCFSDPTIPLNKQDYYVNHEKEGNLIKEIIIPKEYKNKLRNDLNRIGINHAILFPDMSGCAKFIDWKIMGIDDRKK